MKPYCKVLPKILIYPGQHSLYHYDRYSYVMLDSRKVVFPYKNENKQTFDCKA